MQEIRDGEKKQKGQFYEDQLLLIEQDQEQVEFPPSAVTYA